MRYLIYQDGEYEDSWINSIAVEDSHVQEAREILDDVGGYIGEMTKHAENATEIIFIDYVHKKAKRLLKELERVAKERKALNKKTQKDLDQEHNNYLRDQNDFIKGLGSNATIAMPMRLGSLYYGPRKLSAEKNFLTREGNKLTRALEKIKDVNTKTT